MNRFLFSLGTASLTAALSGVANAAFVSPNTWTRGQANTTYQAWDVFTGLSAVTPDVADQNSSGSAELTENSGGSFLTGGGNIYSPYLPLNFTVSLPQADIAQPEHQLTAVVQIKTLGTELDGQSLALNGLPPIDSAELLRNQLGGFGGSEVEHWFLFEIPYSSYGSGSNGVASLTLQFNALESSMSLDQLAIDTAVSSDGFLLEENPFVATALPGDINLDGSIDILDLSILATNYGSQHARWTDGDLSNDDVVDILDLSLLATHYGTSANNPHSQSVPEPALMGWLLSMWFVWKRPGHCARS